MCSVYWLEQDWQGYPAVKTLFWERTNAINAPPNEPNWVIAPNQSKYLLKKYLRLLIKLNKSYLLRSLERKSFAIATFTNVDVRLNIDIKPTIIIEPSIVPARIGHGDSLAMNIIHVLHINEIANTKQILGFIIVI